MPPARRAVLSGSRHSLQTLIRTEWWSVLFMETVVLSRAEKPVPHVATSRDPFAIESGRLADSQKEPAP